jgi:hypothetical protein
VSKILAYADDVNLLVTSQEEIKHLHTILMENTAASGAKINIQKSKALAVGTWNTNINIMNVPYVDELKILGMRFTTTIQRSALASWKQVTRRIKSLTRDAYYRELYLARRIIYVHCYVLGTAWYTAQIFPLPTECERQINAAIAWYLWRGEIFRVPISTLTRQKHQGGWDLVNLAAKSRALFLCRLTTNNECEGSFTKDWLRHWSLHKPTPNPPTIRRIPDSMGYLQLYAMDTAYIPQRDPDES